MEEIESLMMDSIFLVNDLRREVFSFLTPVYISNLRLMSTTWRDILDGDMIMWQMKSQEYFGRDLRNSEVYGRSYMEQFVDLSRNCTCTEYALLTHLPENLFLKSSLREHGEVSVRSRKYPFKTKILPGSRFPNMDHLIKKKVEEPPKSSLIFEHEVDGSLSHEQLKFLYVSHCYFAHLVFSINEWNGFADELKSVIEKKLGDGSFLLFTLDEVQKENFVVKYELSPDENKERMFWVVDFAEKKMKTCNFVDDFEKRFLPALLTEEVDKLIQKYIENEKSLIHSVYIDYQPEKKRVFAYWNFATYGDPIKKLYKNAATKIFGILPFYPIYMSMKKIFTFPPKLNIFKKNKKKKKEKKKLDNTSMKHKKKFEEEHSKRFGKFRSKKELNLKTFKMKYKTFLNNLEFRILEDVGLDVMLDRAHNWIGSSIFWYLRSKKFGAVKSFIIRGSDEGNNSQIVVDFKNNASFPIYDHALSVFGESYMHSVVSETVNSLREDRDFEVLLEKEWQFELEQKLLKMELLGMVDDDDDEKKKEEKDDTE